MLFDEFNNYKYKSIRITPQIMVEIIFQLYKNDNSLYERQDIVKKVIEFHKDKGGDGTEANNSSQTKKALQSINPSYLKNPKRGYWQFFIKDSSEYNSFYYPKKILKTINTTVNIKETNVNLKNGWIYFYYYPSYKELSELKNEIFFPIKIGKSQNQPKFRISEQIGTAIPEKPIVFLEVKTEDCSNLERNLHSTLCLMGRRETKALGKEWFLSNENELLDLIKKLLNLGIKLEINKNSL